MDLIADTTFLVGLWRRQPWALDLARKNESKVFGIPWIVLGEFWHGAVRAGHDLRTVEDFLQIGIPLLDPAPVLMSYARLCTELQEGKGAVYRGVGQNDLWIAAVALAFDRPLITRNRRHFDSIKKMALIVPAGE